MKAYLVLDSWKLCLKSPWKTYKNILKRLKSYETNGGIALAGLTLAKIVVLTLAGKTNFGRVKNS
jgi:hypothetical protein